MQSKSRLGPTLAGCAVAGVTALAAWSDSEQDDHGDTWSTASLLTVGTPQWGQIEDASDADLFRFDLPGLATIEASTSGQTDTRGELLDSSGARLATDDDSGAGANFQIDAVLEPGVYYVQVHGSPGAYAMRVRRGGLPDHGDTAAASTLLKLHSDADLTGVRPTALLATAGRIHPSTLDTDVFRIDVPDAAEVTIRSSGTADTYATLTDNADSPIVTNDSDGNFRIDESLEQGIYYLQVRGHDVGDYRVLAAASSDVVTIRNDGDEEPPDAVTGSVVVNEDGPGGIVRWGSDAYELVSADIDADTLSVTVSYGGGCRTHTFTLVLANAFKLTDPVRLEANLAHNADSDPCEAWLTEHIAFDLTPLKSLFQAGGPQNGTIILELNLANGTQRELHYRF